MTVDRNKKYSKCHSFTLKFDETAPKLLKNVILLHTWYNRLTYHQTNTGNCPGPLVSKRKYQIKKGLIKFSLSFSLNSHIYTHLEMLYLSSPPFSCKGLFHFVTMHVQTSFRKRVAKNICWRILQSSPLWKKKT